MTVATVELFYAILALAAMVAIAGLVVLRLAAAGSDGARATYDGVARAIHPNAMGLAWVVALLATTGSLYFSEIAGFVPCTLCWYQRIAMYPLVVILAVGAARRDRGARRGLPCRARVVPRPRHRRLRRGDPMHARVVPDARLHQPAHARADGLPPHHRAAVDPTPLRRRRAGSGGVTAPPSHPTRRSP